MVGFLSDPVSAVSRPATETECRAAYDFEQHARNCAFCENPYEVHRSHQQLCEKGHRLAQDVAYYIYRGADGETYSTIDENHKLVRVEMPADYTQVRGLLRAIERSLRHRSRTPFVSMDRTYYVAARTPRRSHSVKIEQPKTKRRPRSGEIVEWPEYTKSSAPYVKEINTRRRGSIYAEDLEMLQRNAKRYNVEVREPSARDIRERRHSGYYR
ncbi:hypothetical protein M011DRAFT_430618 [Sporormia fimetaria CBS 119925]|uniref:Uncharacterized protein n=1 Tax=Sporormia fimetaria CBS 119925 TaxID=1340428 RepID=A0A6A6UZA0_9PLEO|nr:hypothetical protein M011DRAFT_430618 [Sporormia fimetaria CBS 119925]